LTYATGAAPRTLDILTVDDHPATDPCPQNHPEHDALPTSRPKSRLSEGEAVRVVLGNHIHPQQPG